MSDNSILIIKDKGTVSKMTDVIRKFKVVQCACVGGDCSFVMRATVMARIDVERFGC